MFKLKHSLLAVALFTPSLAVEEDPFCPCNGLALESQLARILGMAYDPLGPKATFKEATEVFECYAWKDLPYDLTRNGIIHRALNRLHWSTPRALAGRCGRKSDSCVVSFSGAANIDMVAGILDYGPTKLRINASGAIERDTWPTPIGTKTYSFHAFYWEVYDTMRSQVGEQMMEFLSGCNEIVVTGHSIGAGMADLFNWENPHLPVKEITIGQNPAWFGTPPDVGCRGKRVVSEDDPIPYMRPFVDPRGQLIQHGLLPMQLIRKLPVTEEKQGLLGTVVGLVRKKKPAPAQWIAETPTSCDDNVPLDPNCEKVGCKPYGFHYNWVVTHRIDDHQASAYMKATDSAFSKAYVPPEEVEEEEEGGEDQQPARQLQHTQQEQQPQQQQQQQEEEEEEEEQQTREGEEPGSLAQEGDGSWIELKEVPHYAF